MHYPRLIFSLLTLLCLSHLTQAQPSLDIDRSAGPARVWLDGQVGRDYIVESSSDDMSSNGWEFELTLTLTNPPQSWFDSASVLMPKRFYRAVDLEGPAPVEIANDFRLTDHQGKSRSLYYYDEDTNVLAVVLIFTGNGCPNVHQMVSTIKALRNQFTPQGVLFWMIDANSADNRSNIVVKATAAGIDLPILHDRAQIVARAYHASTTPEAICVSKADWSIFYRGAIDDRIGSNAVASTQSYLSRALTDFLAHGVVTLKQTRTAGCDITLSPQPPVSYSADIAPLLQNKCIGCHSPGNIAPFAMTNYNKVRGFSAQIKEEVLAGRMPPWHADPIYGAFSNDSSLRPEQASMLIQWIDEGSPRGGGPDPLETVPPPPADWPLGTPDFILNLPMVENIPATGEVAYRYRTVPLPANFPVHAWLRAAAVRPGNRKVVHHVLVFVGSHNSANNAGGLGGFFAGYVPGYLDTAYPAGTGKRLYRTNSLEFQLHYTTAGTPQTDDTQLGLYLAPSQPPMELQTRSSYRWGGLAVGAGVSDQPVSATTYKHTFSRNAYLYEMSPHMHLRGSRFRYEAVYPGGAREVLLAVPRYDFLWQTLYRLAKPKYLPAGTIIECSGAWDNSPMNKANPNPNASVYFGEQTDDEMFIGFFNFAEIPRH